MHQDAMELALDINGADSMLIDTGGPTGSWPGAARDKRRDGYPVSPMMSVVLLQPQRDHLGRHEPDPAQHRRRARARAAEGTADRLTPPSAGRHTGARPAGVRRFTRLS